MSRFEIFLIIAFSLTPIISLVIILQGRKKKIGKEQKVDPPKQFDVVEAKPEQSKPVEDKTLKNVFDNSSIDTSEFKNYLNNKTSTTSKPVKKETIEGKTLPYFADDDFKVKKPETKSINQQIKDLSPELTALIITGILDRKDY